MKNETITFDKLPEAVGYLTEQVIELSHRTEKDGVGTPASPIGQTNLG